MEKQEMALEVIKRLKEEYPDADCTLDYNEAWKLLVSVRLAAQCTDARVNIVVEKLYEKYPDVEFYFIMGADSLDYFEEWKHPEIICEKAVVLVAVRDHWNMEDVKKKIHAIEQLFHAKIYPLSCDRFDAASRNIRQMIKKGEDTGQLLPYAVSQFIKEHHLYENEK